MGQKSRSWLSLPLYSSQIKVYINLTTIIEKKLKNLKVKDYNAFMIQLKDNKPTENSEATEAQLA